MSSVFFIRMILAFIFGGVLAKTDLELNDKKFWILIVLYIIRGYLHE